MPTPPFTTVASLPPHTGDPRALCRYDDPDLWFPASGGGPDGDVAKAICRRCPLVDACLAYALRHEPDHGILGATDPRERRAIIAGRARSDRRVVGDLDRVRRAFDLARRVAAGHATRTEALDHAVRYDLDVAICVIRNAPHLADDVIAGHLSLRAAGVRAQAAKQARRVAA